jgi:hypothetical protein
LNRLAYAPALDRTPGRLPLPEGDRVVQRCTAGDDRAVGLDVRTGVEKGVEGVDIAAGGGPTGSRWRTWPRRSRVALGCL